MSKPSPPLTQQERLAIHHRRFQKMGQPAAAPPSPPTQGEEEFDGPIMAQLVRNNDELRAALRQRADEATAPLREALKSAQHLIRDLGGQHGELLDQIEEALK